MRNLLNQKISGRCAPSPSISGPKFSQIGSTSEIFRAKKRLSSRPPCTQPPVRGVSYVWATTLNFGPDVQLREWTYRPKYRSPRPIATGTKRPEKNPKNRFPTKWRRKLLLVPVFGHILVLHPRLGRFSQKSQKFFRGTFLRYLGSKLKTSKII